LFPNAKHLAKKLAEDKLLIEKTKLDMTKADKDREVAAGVFAEKSA